MNNIRMDLIELRCEALDWIHLNKNSVLRLCSDLANEP